MQITTDAFGNALGNSIAEANWSGTAQDSTSYGADEQARDFARENVRFAEAAAMNMRLGGPLLVADNGQFMTDVGSLYGDMNFGEPVKPTATSDAVYNILLGSMQNPRSAAGPRIMLDDFGNPVYPNLVTDERVMAADGTPGLRATGAVRTAYADALNQVKTMDVKRIFDPTDPHQYMIFVADDGTRNDANQAIPTNPRTLSQLVDRSANVFPIYVSGVGTENDLGGLNSALGLGAPVQVTQTLARITEKVNTVVQNDPDAKFVFVDTGFSRGSGVIRAVQNILVEQGVPDLSSGREVTNGEGSTKVFYDRHIIAPGAVNVGASLVYDTVSSGMGNLYNMAIPSQVWQTLHLAAANEYRTMFPLTSALNERGASDGSVVEMSLPGAHTNLGGGSYDLNGIGAANLEIGYTYLQRAGVPLVSLPDSMRPNPSQFAIYDSRWVHDVPFGQLVNDPNANRVIKYGK